MVMVQPMGQSWATPVARWVRQCCHSLRVGENGRRGRRGGGGTVQPNCLVGVAVLSQPGEWATTAGGEVGGWGGGRGGVTSQLLHGCCGAFTIWRVGEGAGGKGNYI
jgi:hypothetical protein